MHVPDNHPLLLGNLLAKAQTSPAEYLGASVRLVEGFGTKGAKSWPFNYHAAVRSFGSWVYRAATLRAKAVAKVKLRLYVRTPKGVRKARDFRTKSAWRMAVLERLDAANRGCLTPGDGDGVLLYDTRPVPTRRKRFLAGDARGGSPGDRVLAKVAEFGGDGYEEVTEPHPTLQVLSTINPWMNGFELSILRWTYLLLTGNAYLHPVIDPRTGVPSEVWPMPSQWVSVIPDRETLIRGYSYGADRTTAKEFAPDEVIQWRLPNPEDPFFYGRGCVEAVWSALGLHKDKRLMDAAKFQNMARPDWLLCVKGNNGEALNRLEAAVDQKLRGAHNTGRMLAVNGDGVTATALNLPVDEIGDADRVIEEIAAGFEIPVSMLLGNDPVKANSESMVNSFLRDTVLPDTALDAEKLNERWLPLFGVGDDAVLAYDSPMIDDAELELKRVTQLRQFGIIDGNEAREEEGYGPHADGDALLFAGKPIGDSAVEAATAVAEATAPDPAQAGDAGATEKPPAKTPKGKAADSIETKAADEGHWVTIHGAHVLIDDAGDIKKGPDHLVGKNVNDIHRKVVSANMPPLKEGHARAVHLTNSSPESFADGLDYSKYGMLQSTARSWGNESEVEYHGSGDPRYRDARYAVVMDIPYGELRAHGNPARAPGVVPREHIVGILDRHAGWLVQPPAPQSDEARGPSAEPTAGTRRPIASPRRPLPPQRGKAVQEALVPEGWTPDEARAVARRQMGM